MSTTIDRFDLMRTFVRVAETGSLTAAARSLGLTQPSVSRQLKQLEDLLSAKLAHRTTHDLTLTAEGKGFLADCRRLLDDWEAVGERVGGGGAPSGLLRVIAPVGLGQTLLVDLAAAFRARYPAIRFDWLLTDGPADLVAEGADCLIRAGRIDDTSLVIRQLAEVRRIVVATSSLLEAHGEKAATAPLDRLPAIALRPFYGASLRLFTRDGEPVTVRIEPAFASNDIFAVARAARAGIGFALLPAWLVADDLKAGRLVQIAPTLEGERLPITVGYPAGRYRPARVSEFVATLREELPGLLEP